MNPEGPWLHRLLQRLPADPVLRRLQRTLGCYEPADFRRDLRSNLVRIVTPERFVMRLLGIGDVPRVAGELPAACVANVSSRLCDIDDLLRRMDMHDTDDFWDIGSGMGGVAILVNWLSGARSSGVEFHREYHDRAQQAAREFRLPAVRFVHGDARSVDYSTGTKFFMFTPFTGAVLETVLTNLRGVAADHPITLGWQGPRSHLSDHTWLREVDEAPVGHAFSLKVYRSV